MRNGLVAAPVRSLSGDVEAPPPIAPYPRIPRCPEGRDNVTSLPGAIVSPTPVASDSAPLKSAWGEFLLTTIATANLFMTLAEGSGERAAVNPHCQNACKLLAEIDLSRTRSRFGKIEQAAEIQVARDALRQRIDAFLI